MLNFIFQQKNYEICTKQLQLSRHTYTIPHLDTVQLFCQTRTQLMLPEYCSIRCTITYLHGPSAFFLIVEMSSLILPKYVIWLVYFKTNILVYCCLRFENFVQIGVQSTRMTMLPTNAEMFSWQMYTEDLTTSDQDSGFSTYGLLDQVNVTRDASDYLWYTTK